MWRRCDKTLAPCALLSVVADWLNSCVTCTWVTIYCRNNKQLPRLPSFPGDRKGLFQSFSSLSGFGLLIFRSLASTTWWLIDSSCHSEKLKFKFLLLLLISASRSKSTGPIRNFQLWLNRISCIQTSNWSCCVMDLPYNRFDFKIELWLRWEITTRNGVSDAFDWNQLSASKYHFLPHFPMKTLTWLDCQNRFSTRARAPSLKSDYANYRINIQLHRFSRGKGEAQANKRIHRN